MPVPSGKRSRPGTRQGGQDRGLLRSPNPSCNVCSGAAEGVWLEPGPGETSMDQPHDAIRDNHRKMRFTRLGEQRKLLRGMHPQEFIARGSSVSVGGCLAGVVVLRKEEAVPRQPAAAVEAPVRGLACRPPPPPKGRQGTTRGWRHPLSPRRVCVDPWRSMGGTGVLGRGKMVGGRLPASCWAELSPPHPPPPWCWGGSNLEQGPGPDTCRTAPGGWQGTGPQAGGAMPRGMQGIITRRTKHMITY